MVIDLRKLREPLAADIRNSLSAFSAQHANTPICTVGLWGDGFHGTASLHLDTPDHSAAFVEQWLKNGPDWYGEDGQGRFCNNCWDMPHCIGEYSFPGYPDLYQAEVDAPVDYIAIDGSKLRAEADEGDEGKNRIVFPFLRVVLAEFEPFRQLPRIAPFRIGVQMRDSLCAEFWLVPLEESGS
jgi:hypothetical protein